MTRKKRKRRFLRIDNDGFEESYRHQQPGPVRSRIQSDRAFSPIAHPVLAIRPGCIDRVGGRPRGVAESTLEQPCGAVAERFDFDAHAIEHRNIEVAQRHVGCDVLAGGNRSAATAT